MKKENRNIFLCKTKIEEEMPGVVVANKITACIVSNVLISSNTFLLL